MRRNWHGMAAGAAWILLTGWLNAAGEPSYPEICAVIRTNLEGVTEKDLEHAALQGLLAHFAGRVSLTTNNLPTAPSAPLVTHAAIYEESFGYLRIGRVASGLREELAKAAFGLTATNPVKGLVLDLRWADGSDYAAAGEAAGLFIAREGAALLQWGGEVVKSGIQGPRLPGPIMILINRATAGAAEALAAVLRENRVGLLIGSPTAGRAAVAREIKLSTGHLLWVAAAPVKTGGGQVLTGNNLKPDIAVVIPEMEEAAYLKDPYGTNSPSGRLVKPRLNEAELVRLKREGFDVERDPEARPSRAAEPAKPVIKDPALARAVDLLKALAVVQNSKWR